MKTLLLILTSLFLTTFSLAAPNYVDCSNSSTPFSDQSLGESGFGIIDEIPQGGLVLKDFVYGKTEEKAWAKMIADRSIYRVAANCKQKINNGVMCAFDIAGAKEEGTTLGSSLSDSVTELTAVVIDTDIEQNYVEIRISIGTEKPVPFQGPRFKNLIKFDNYYFNNCKSLNVLEQG